MSINPIHIRLLSQQLAAPQFTRPEEVVAHFGAMQAQDLANAWEEYVRYSQSRFKK